MITSHEKLAFDPKPGQKGNAMQDPQSLTVTCRACGAKPGELCKSGSGHDLERVHWGRPHYEDIERKRVERQGIPSGGPGPRGHYERGKWVGESAFKISDGQWAADHAGACGVCGGPGRLYPGGWLCGTHRPRTAEVS